MTLPSNANYSGCFWEPLNDDGTPGFGTSTSLCHAWSSGPTAELTRSVLGIQPVQAGFTRWQVVPQTLGLTSAKGTQPTPYGDVSVSWTHNNGLFSMSVLSPSGTNGTVQIPTVSGGSASSEQVVSIVNGRITSSSVHDVNGGEPFELSQYTLSSK